MTQNSLDPGDQIPAARRIQAQTLTPEAFAPYGHVARPGLGDVKAIRNDRVHLSKSETAFSHQPDAKEVKLDFYEVAPETHQLVASVIERHNLSSQMFSPMNAARWLVVIWPDGPARAPLAFVAGPQDVVTYAPGLWHHGIAAIDRPACFTSLMWKKGDIAVDTEFLTLDRAWGIGWPDGGPEGLSA
ncbi:ureidoglycolate lyase [Antarcticimicrobium sediminis]|uniref:Ureidoglycolate hydrolase n=1 Tax=Antarcticimicrobium sediminis TaxID=2546227 RepID=A0A4R5EVJ8_9RHOB|nr:ureidoglycolate lyase [Antarcticimicrobium sediminis]TDE38850.1 ureidoglycolate hydrolase [Antarcticimicrobium sediminis]